MIFKFQLAWRSADRNQRIIDFIRAGALFRLPVALRRRLFTGDQHFCPICQTRLRHFLVLQRAYHLWCPVCQSLQRERLGWILLNSTYVQIEKLPGYFLHIAPEPALSNHLFAMKGQKYISADLHNKQAGVRLDISDIPLPNRTVDLLYCSHVLEHVPDDRRVLQEFRRILSSQGLAILIVPIYQKTTIEDPNVSDPFERQQLFGQYDHVRCYGPDFVDRLQAVGFEVQTIYTEDLVNSHDIFRMGLIAKDPIFICRVVSQPHPPLDELHEKAVVH